MTDKTFSLISHPYKANPFKLFPEFLSERISMEFTQLCLQLLFTASDCHISCFRVISISGATSLPEQFNLQRSLCSIMSKFTPAFRCLYTFHCRNVNTLWLPFILSVFLDLSDLCSHWYVFWDSAFLLLTSILSSSNNTDFPQNNITHSTISTTFSDSSDF